LPTNEELLATLSKGAPEVIEVDTFIPENQLVKKDENKVYNTVGITEKPDFPGGIIKFYKFVGENYKIQSDFKGNGKIYISFMVETDGSISDLEVL
jgi:hypothetical protein